VSGNRVVASRRRRRWSRASPQHGGGRYPFFNRYYCAQQDRQGAVIDERFNGGGSAADSIVELLNRPLQGCASTPKFPQVVNRQVPAADEWLGHGFPPAGEDEDGGDGVGLRRAPSSRRR
jgi:hypothetical protein